MAVLIIFGIFAICGAIAAMAVPHVGVRVMVMLLVVIIAFSGGKYYHGRQLSEMTAGNTVVCVEEKGCYSAVFVEYVGNRKQTMDRATFGNKKGWLDSIVLEDTSQFTFGE